MKKNFIKKVMIGGLITSLCICFCFINVKGSVIDDNADLFDSYFYFEPKEYSSIQTYDDLKGTIWHLNFDLFQEREYDTDFTISLYFGINEDDNHLFNLPFVIQLRNDYLKNSLEYPLFPNANISICPLVDENDTSAIILNSNQGGAYGYLNFYSYQETNFEGKVDIGVIKNIVYQSKFLYVNNSYLSSYQDIGFFSTDNLNNDKYGSSEIYLFFPLGNYDIYDFTSSNTNFLTLLKNGSTMVNLSNSTVGRIFSSYQNGYDTGYNVGYDAGYNEAIDVNDNIYRFPFLTGIFNGVSDLLSIEIFPNIQLGYFVFVPLALGITGMIFWFWRKD